MVQPILFGAAYSVYVRIVRLVLQEKGVPYKLVETDVFGDPEARARQGGRHPFGKIPAFEHGCFRLYETAAISRYVDEAFPGPALQPSTPELRARMAQAISILDSYAYRTFVWDIYVERVSKPKDGRLSDEAVISAVLPKARLCLKALEALHAEPAWIAGPDLSLADLHAVPMFDYAMRAPEFRELLADCPRLMQWWIVISARRSAADTAFP